MTDRPIIFSGPMVRALLAGRKTMTRRLAWQERHLIREDGRVDPSMPISPWPSPWQRVKPGDRLWVREACGTGGYFPAGWAYRADGVEYPGEKWKPSIHMPRRASRLTLLVTATKIERLRDINGTDAIAEGLVDLGLEGERWHWDPRAPKGYFAPWRAFAALWDHVHGAGAWNANPEVVALSFRVIKSNIDRTQEAA